MNDSNKIVESTILFKLSFGLPAQTRQAKSDSVELYAGESGEIGKERPDEKSNRLVKNLFTNCAELAAIKSLNNNLYRKIQALSVPSQDMFKDSLMLFARSEIVNVNRLIEQHHEKWLTLKAAFVTKYPQLVQEQAKLLTVLFNEDDYDSLETVENRITVTSNWIRFGFPDIELQGVSMSIYEKESREFKEKLDRTGDEVIQNLRLGTKLILDKLKENLTVARGEKPKGFHSTLIENTMESIRLFRSNNFLNDSVLAEQVNKIESLFTGKDADEYTKELKKDTSLRETVLNSVNEIRDVVVEMVKVPSRRVVLKPKAE